MNSSYEYCDIFTLYRPQPFISICWKVSIDTSEIKNSFFFLSVMEQSD